MKNESSLEDILGQISKWKIEASSNHNDGWTRQHYKRMLDEVRSSLSKALPEIEEGEDEAVRDLQSQLDNCD